MREVDANRAVVQCAEAGYNKIIRDVEEANMKRSEILSAGTAFVLMAVVALAGCDAPANDEPSISITSIAISGTPQMGQKITADVIGKTYGDITWLWSGSQDFLECYILSSGPSKVITVPSVVYGTGSPISSYGTYIRARVDKAGIGDYVYSNLIGPITGG
jgi:hypothetical protein